jgi:flagellar biosynthesis protein FlhG
MANDTMADAEELDDGIEDEQAEDIPVSVSIEEEGPWADSAFDSPAGEASPRAASRGDLALPAAPEPGSSSEPRTVHVIAVAAGRGGAGKSLLAANIAVYLAQIGKRVIAVDADPAGGPLNFMLGTLRPTRGFGSFLRGRADSLDELAIDTSVAGVRLVAGEAQPFGSVRSKISSKAVLAAIRQLPADYVVVDLGAPDSGLGLDVWLSANTPLVVSLTDPSSIEATYRFLKSGFLRRLRGERGGEKHLAHLTSALPAPIDIFRAAELASRTRDDRGGAAPLRDDPATAGGTPSVKSPARLTGMALVIAETMSLYRPRLIISQTRSTADTKLGPQIAMAARRRLGHVVDYVGHVETDETVAAAARRRRPVMAEFPEAKICKNIERIARRLISVDSDRNHAAPPPRSEDDQTFYELLETEPGVSDEEVRRAYRLFKEVYAPSSPVICGLYEESELTALHARAESAHDTLFAPERRRQYDLSLPEADLARAVRRAAHGARAQAVPLPPLNVDESLGEAMDPQLEITGEVLRKIREQRGLELSDIAQRTRISERHLRSIEQERFDELPAPVYVRGFVGQLARILKVDAGRAVEHYLRRFHGANGPGHGTPTLREITPTPNPIPRA